MEEYSGPPTDELLADIQKAAKTLNALLVHAGKRRHWEIDIERTQFSAIGTGGWPGIQVRIKEVKHLL